MEQNHTFGIAEDQKIQEPMKSKTEVKKSSSLKIIIYFFVGLFVFLLLAVVIRVFDNPRKTSSGDTIISTEDDYSYTVVEGDEASNNSILSINISGVILTQRTSELGLFDFLDEGSITYGYDVKDKLVRAADSDKVKGILLEINSPGGTVGGAKAIADGVEYFKQQTGKPVYAHITDVGASGGYWVAASSDYILAEYGSTVGSIGVIMGPFTFYDGVVAETGLFGGVQTENGITYRYFTAGEFKDTGSPYRPLTEEEEAHWQTALNNEYRIFVSYVSTMRGLSEDFIRNRVQALPYENTRAVELGLIDEVGSRDNATLLLLDAAGIPATDYNVITEEPILGFFEELFGVFGSLIPQPEVKVKGCALCNKPLVLYDRSFSLMQY